MDNRSYAQRLADEKAFGWTFYNESQFPHYKFEEHDPYWFYEIISKSQYFGAIVGGFYIFGIFRLQNWMKSRPAFNLKRGLFWWNLFLSVGTIFGLTRCIPGFFYTLQQPNGVYKTICVKEGMDAGAAYWGFIFIFSKIVELGDTVFIILRKRPLQFIQWYHHFATLAIAWATGIYAEPILRWYGILNAFVHSLMYPYFTLKAADVHVPVWIANIITSLQLGQMFGGFGINMISLYLLYTGVPCYRHSFSIQAFALVYGTFIFVFGKLFVDSVILKGKLKKVNRKSS